MYLPAIFPFVPGDNMLLGWNEREDEEVIVSIVLRKILSLGQKGRRTKISIYIIY
jgi:hypothetical protein